MERGTSDRLTWDSSARALARPQELAMATPLPASMPSNSAGQCLASNARCCQIGTAKATVAGPNSNISQWVAPAYSA
ncbi:hypothetical protein D3C84_1176390 [compost metagenome]